MKKGLKKGLAAAVIGAMCLSMAACGGSSGAAASTETVGGTEAAAESSGEVVLEFPCTWVGTDSKAEVFGQMVADFNEAYDGQYQVNISEYTDYDAYYDYIRTTVSTGSVPDLFSVKTLADVALYSSSGKVMDLTDFLAGDEMASKYSDGVIASAQVDGANYAMPWEAAIVPVMYNGTLLKEAGVTELPATYEELIAVFDTLKASGIDTPCSFMTSSNAWTAMLWYTYLIAAEGGADVLSEDWNTAVFQNAADKLVTMYGYAPSDAIGAAASDVNSHFFNGETAVYTNGTWILASIKENAAEGIYENLQFAAGPNNSMIQYTQAYIMAADTDDAEKQAAVEAFLTWITDADRLTELSNSSGAVFVVKTNEVENEYINTIIALRDAADIIIPSFESYVSTICANDFSPQLESLLLGDITTEEFVLNLQADNAE